MRHITRVLFSTVAMLVMTGCGSQSAPTSEPGTPTPTPTATPTGSATQPPVFPLTITRIGGVAGFHDVLVVAADGLVSVIRKGQEQRQCRLTPAALKAVTTSATQVAWPRITPASTSPSFPDDLVTMVQSPAGGPVRLEDSQIGTEGKVFQTLFDDLNSGQSASTMCTPV